MQHAGDRKQGGEDRQWKAGQHSGEARADHEAEDQQHRPQHDGGTAGARAEAEMRGHASGTMTDRHSTDPAGQKIGDP